MHQVVETGEAQTGEAQGPRSQREMIAMRKAQKLDTVCWLPCLLINDFFLVKGYRRSGDGA